MKITEIAFSSYPVTDVTVARTFYEGVLGLTATSEVNMGEKGHWIEYDIGPGTLAIGRSPDWLPSKDGCTVALEVEDFDQARATIEYSKTPIRMGPIATPGCNMIMVKDPDENTVILHKRRANHSHG